MTLTNRTTGSLASAFGFLSTQTSDRHDPPTAFRHLLHMHFMQFVARFGHLRRKGRPRLPRAGWQMRELAVPQKNLRHTAFDQVLAGGGRDRESVRSTTPETPLKADFSSTLTKTVN
ncbi:hypothetical protein [Rhodoblastus sp.]|uniref:hypothetical protein n=1 Tax=Rhodoblastus sp. TaxID=1962975 RepID=UPI002622F711|nr:hypothetical protein [Rhodoblastus sp.]